MAAVRVAFFDIGGTLVRSRTDGTQIMVEGALRVVETFREKGVLTGLISNTGTLTMEQLVELLPTEFDFSLFEPTLTVLSSDPEVGVAKPDAAIFALAYARATLLAAVVKPSECFFFGEDPIEVLAAQAVGLIGVRVVTDDGGTELSSLLGNLEKSGFGTE